MGFKNRIRGIGKETLFPELGGNAGTITMDPIFGSSCENENGLLIQETKFLC